MNITAQTTDEQIFANLVAAKKTLAEFAAEQIGSDIVQGERLVALAQNVRTAEDLAGVQLQYRSVLANKPENAMAYLLSVVTRRDDTWSGRQNDSRRSAMDAICAWANDAAFDLRNQA